MVVMKHKWLRPIIEWTAIAALFIGLSLYLSRNMLPPASVAPELRLPQLTTIDPTSANLSLDVVQWQAAEKTLVYFFAPWCGVCRASMPGLTLLASKDTQVVTVALDWKTTEEVSQFVDKVGFEGKVLLGTAATKTAFQIDAYPSYYVIDKNGQVLHKDRGFSTPPGMWLRLQ